MALTILKQFAPLMGMELVVMTITGDGVATTVDTGFTRILHYQLNTATTGATFGSTKSAGTITASTLFVNATEYTLLAFGR